MKIDRDSLLIGLTLVPAAVLATLYVTMQSTGQVPVDVLGWLTIPALPQISLDVPSLPFVSDVQNAIQLSGHSALEVGLGVAAGLVGGMIVVAGLYDLTRWVRAMVHRCNGRNRTPSV